MKCVCVQHHGGGQLLTQEKEWIGGNESKNLGLQIDNSQKEPNRNIFTNFMCFEFVQLFLVKLEVDNS